MNDFNLNFLNSSQSFQDKMRTGVLNNSSSYLNYQKSNTSFLNNDKQKKADANTKILLDSINKKDLILAKPIVKTQSKLPLLTEIKQYFDKGNQIICGNQQYDSGMIKDIISYQDKADTLAASLTNTGKTRIGDNGAIYFETENGGVFSSNQWVDTSSLTDIGENIGKKLQIIGVIVDAGQVYCGVYKDKWTYGKHAQLATAEVTGSTIGGWAGMETGAVAGAEIGGLIGVWFFGAGAVPGAAIGGIAGAIFGGFFGSYLGDYDAKKIFNLFNS